MEQTSPIFSLATENFNHTAYGEPQEAIVFIGNTSLYLNCLISVQDVLKWSHYKYITAYFWVSSLQLKVLPNILSLCGLEDGYFPSLNIAVGNSQLCIA